jgi:predicted phage gp36 major capsid-like protein
MTGFWLGGPAAYGAALRQEYQSRVRALKERLRHVDSDEQRRQIAEELRDLKAELLAKIARMGRSLLGTP